MNEMNAEKRRFNNLVAVTNAAGDRVPHLFRRGEKFYAVAYAHGKRKVQSLPSCLNGQGQPVMSEVRRYCAEFVKRVEAGDWSALAATRKRVDDKLATGAEIVAAYQDSCRQRSAPRPETVAINVRQFARFVEMVGQTMSQPCGWLTEDALDAAARKMQDGTEADTPEREARDRTIDSFLGAVKSVLAYPRDFKDLRMPELSAFREYSPVSPKLADRSMPPREVVEATVRAGRALAEVSQHLAAIWALGYDCGLRPGEIEAARWGWIVVDDVGEGQRQAFIEVRDRPDEYYRVKSSRCKRTRSRRVPVPAAVLEALRSGQPAADQFIMAPEVLGPSARHEIITRLFAVWFKAVHPWWQQRKKAAYELRRLRGCWWAIKYGAELTQRWMGHTTYQTTQDYYADLPQWDEPQALDVGPWFDRLRLRRL